MKRDDVYWNWLRNWKAEVTLLSPLISMALHNVLQRLANRADADYGDSYMKTMPDFRETMEKVVSRDLKLQEIGELRRKEIAKALEIVDPYQSEVKRLALRRRLMLGIEFLVDEYIAELEAE